MQDNMGALTGSKASPQAATHLGPTGYDPARVLEGDSDNYGRKFFGILNAQGQFWTPLAFDSEDRAWAHVDGFWRGDPSNLAYCRSRYRVVPVRIRLKAIAIETEGGDAKQAPSRVARPSHKEKRPEVRLNTPERYSDSALMM